MTGDGKRAAASSWRWEIGHGDAAIDNTWSQWNELAQSCPRSLTADAVWMRAFWHAFGLDGERLVVHSLYDGDTLVALVPVQRTGRILRVWSAIANAHTPYWMCPIAPSCPDVGARIIDHLLGSGDLIDFGPLHETGPLCTTLMDAARARRLHVDLAATDGDASITLDGPWARFRQQKLSSNLREDTERKHRRLERLGKLSSEVVAGGEALSQVLGESFDLEALGWKGTQGSPIKSAPETLRFYTELAQGAAAAGHLALYTLRLDSRLIAFEYCLKAQQRIDMLKLSFHPDLSQYSPGNVLRLLILKMEIEQNEVASYHLGRPHGWKLRWATRVEPLVRLRIYRKGVAGVLGYYLGPRLRRTLRKSATLRSAVRWLGRRGAHST
jgi:CelD/BcsL family acetyltransferase involved in cellulose biosynthesis